MESSFKRSIFFLVLLCSSCAFKNNTVDMVLHNAVIYSVDEGFTVHEALAVDSGKIVGIGAEREILNKYVARKKIDAMGRAVFPGFIDSHCHFVAYGLGRDKLDLVGTKSWEDCLEKLKVYAKESPSYWIEGHGWDQNDWESSEFPNNEELNELFPDRPVLLGRIDGHAAVANEKALQLALIDGPQRVIGGEVVLDENMRPTGLLIDKAMNKVLNAIPQPEAAQLEHAILKAQQDCFAYGLTTVDEAGLDTTVIGIIDKMHQSGDLKMRVYAMLEATDAGRAYMKKGKVLKDRLTVRSVKLYGDGALGSRGAALKRDYHDKHGHKGGLLHKPVFYKQWAALCDLYGFQMNTHCIGDRANQLLLAIYAEQLEGVNDKRWRVEHAQLVTGGDIEQFSKYNILPSVQPTHATSDMPWVEERIGHERLQGAYANSALLEQNGMVLLGTDFPIEGVDPLMTFYAAVFRKNDLGEPMGGWYTHQALSREDAIRGMTIWGAIGNFEEEQKGSLEVGKMADMVILDRDIMRVSEDDVRKAKVVSTIVDGEVVFPVMR